jgi:hypothetical protein
MDSGTSPLNRANFSGMAQRAKAFSIIDIVVSACTARCLRAAIDLIDREGISWSGDEPQDRFIAAPKVNHQAG